MTDYNDGNWHGWNGGECPVHPKTNGEFVFANGSIATIKPAGEWNWSDEKLPIIAFRVTKPYRGPREFWIDTITGRYYTDWQAPGCDYIIHVREVIE